MNMRAAINAKCRDCSYDEQDDGTWRSQVLRCSCPDCPLYALRPLPTGIKYGTPAYQKAMTQ